MSLFGFPAQSELETHSTQNPAAVSQYGVEVVAEQSPEVVHPGTHRFVSVSQVLLGAVQSDAIRHSTQVFDRVLQRGKPTLDWQCVSFVHQTQVCDDKSHTVPFAFPVQPISEVHSTQKPSTSQ